MTDKTTKKLMKLPDKPGVYLYKDANGKIIYVGKAAVLKHRIRQYFQLARPKDTKTDLLVADIADIDWLIVGSEIEALFLESELIKRYKPKYNIELRDDKHYEYVRIDLNSPHPTVQMVRQPMDDRAVYVGPFVEGIRKALKFLRQIFPYDTKVPVKEGSKLLADLGLSPGIEIGKTSLKDYRATLKLLIRYLKGNNKALLKQMNKDMKAAARDNEFEKAARLRDQINSLRRLNSQIIFGDSELFDITKDQALDGLTKLLDEHGLFLQQSHLDGVQGGDEERSKTYKKYDARAPESPARQSAKSSDRVSGSARQQVRAVRLLHRIEGYDISHMSGTNNVASQVVFVDGVADKRSYRKYKMRSPGNDDFAHMREVLSRRFSGRGLASQPLPDLLLIDGGKGQVGAAQQVLRELGLPIPFIGLAKRFETIIIPESDNGQPLREVVLPHDSPIIKLLQRIRDESHRFAVSYHTSLKVKSQKASLLDAIEGVGPITRKKLIKHFGSLRAIEAADKQQLQELLGVKRGMQLWERIKLND